MKLDFGWKYLDMLIVVAAVIMGIAVWFVPDYSQTPEAKAMYKAVAQRKAEREAYEAQEGRIKKQNDDEGIVYFGPTDKYMPGDHAREKPASQKSAPKTPAARPPAAKSPAAKPPVAKPGEQ